MAQYDLDHNVIVCCYIYSYDISRYETHVYTLTPPLKEPI